MEENILFKSHVVHDLPTCKEFQRGYNLNSAMAPFSRVILILCTIFFCLDIKNPTRSIGFLVLLALWGLVYLICWLCGRNGNVYYKRQLANNFGKPLAG